jgi:hypothetical protein
MILKLRTEARVELRERLAMNDPGETRLNQSSGQTQSRALAILFLAANAYRGPGNPDCGTVRHRSLAPAKPMEFGLRYARAP